MTDSADPTRVDRPHRRTALIATELKRYGIDIAALSETRLASEDSLTENGEGYTFFWRGLPEEAARIHGMGFAKRSSLLNHLPETPVGVSERLMTLRIPLAAKRYATVVSAYAPTLPSAENIKDEFYDLLDRTLRSIPQADKIILLGDFNARVGTNYNVWGGVIGKHGVGSSNPNGLRLLNLCADHDLVITNTVFQLANKYKTTWMHPRSKHWHLIDYVIVRRNDLQDVIVTRALRGAECWTDHRLVRSIFRLRIRPPVRKRASRKQMNRAALRDPAKREDLQRELTNAINALEPTFANDESPTTAWDNLSSTIMGAATTALGYTQRRHQDWFDDNSPEIHRLLQEKNTAHDAATNNPSSAVLRSRFSELRKEVQVRLRQMEDKWWIDKACEIQCLADDHDLHGFYNAVKTIYGPTSGSTVPIKSADGSTLIKDRQGVVSRWAEHFNELLNRINPADPEVINRLPSLPPFAEMDSTPSFPEILRAIKALKNNKAAGPDGIPGEIFKYGGDLLHQRLYHFICVLWESERLPQQWKDANIVTIYKRKGDKSICGNYRGISLLSVAGKVLARVMLSRLISFVSDVVLPESQCGFRKERSTTDMIFVARLLQEKCREQHRDLYIAFVDLTKAFDTVNRSLLWTILAKFGCPPRFIKILQEFHTGMFARVVVGGLESDPFEVKVGVKQGCVLAPVLFNIYMSAVTLLSRYQLQLDDGVAFRYRLDGSLFNLRRLKALTKTRNMSVFELQYADDAAFISHTAEGLQRTLSTTADTYTSTGLVINARKTEVLHQHSALGEQPPVTAFKVGAEDIRQVDSFTYLGSVLSSSCDIEEEIQNRLRQATSAFGRLSRRVFLNHNITISTKVAVYNAVCVSTLLYGCEAWTIYRANIRSLEAFHIKCLQRILGITWADRVPHVTVLQRAGCVSVEALIIQRQLRWLGHVCRMEDSRLPRTILYGELTTGHRSAGGQKKRFKDHLKMTLKRCGVPPSNLEHLTSDRVTWRSTCHNAVETLESARTQTLEERRRRRHARIDRGPLLPGEGIPCPTCGRTCASEFGLRSHQRRHRGRHDLPP